MASAPLSYLCVAVLAALLARGSCGLPSARIWGGEEATAGSYPYVASVRLDYAHICGGTIISEKDILTAADCLYEDGVLVAMDRLTVRVGSTNQFAGGQVVYVSSVSLHPMQNLALVKLIYSLEWSDTISKIDYAMSWEDTPPEGAVVTVAGWGDQGGSISYKLHYMTFTVASDEVCDDAYSGNDNKTICLQHALNEGSCYGDAGNGAFYNDKVVGISNFVVGTCGSRYPDVFLNVAHFFNFITNHLS